MPPANTWVVAYGFFGDGLPWIIPEVQLYTGLRFEDFDGTPDSSVTHWLLYPELPTDNLPTPESNRPIGGME
jgi:hypothetical protein